MIATNRYCEQEMRGGTCALDSDHRGRCTTKAWYCDGCGKMRKGSPAAQARDINGDVDVEFCFLCTLEGSR